MTTTPEQGVPLSQVIFAFSPFYVLGLITRAIEMRGEASEGARSALNSAITDSIVLDGFRDASKAPSPLLNDRVVEELLDGNDRLAGAVLRAWAESHRDIHDLAIRHLSGQDIPVDGPNLEERVFDSWWPRDEWMRQIGEIVDANGDLDEDDVGMMLCYVSGMAPIPDEDEPEIGSPVLSEWVDRLRELPPDAPEWEDVDAFVMTVAGIAAEKAAERAAHQAESLVETLTELQRSFESELRYLGLDLASWQADIAESPVLIPDALELVEALKAGLIEYHPVRPQADSREEEAARAVERAEHESAILGVAAEWEGLVNPTDDPEDDPHPDGPDEVPEGETSTADSDGPGDVRAHADAQSGEQPPPSPGPGPGAADTETPERTVSTDEHEALLSELDRLKRHGESLEVENARLARARSDLESDKRSLDDENSELRDELSQSRDLEETWRQAYISAKAVDSDGANEPPPQLVSVSEAVARAESSFPEQLVFALNSKSAKNSPFQRPDEVFAALAWLATVYHQRRTRPGDGPHFDKLLKESCSGWSYKPKQTDVTKEQFDEWYTTTVDGKVYDLDAHLGKGNTHDPKNTLRIAFAWDGDRNRVIVGYIGLHQRNRRS